MEPDLDKARDEKCVPIAHDVLAFLAENLLPETPESTDQFDKAQLYILQKSLDLDLNITTEVQYLFQLMLGGLSGLNAAVQAVNLAPLDDARYAEIGRKILRVLAETKPRLTAVTPEDTAADFADAKMKLQVIFDEEKLNPLELKYITDTIFQSFTSLNNLVADSLSKSSEAAEAKLFGITFMSDLTVKHVNEVLMNDVSVMFSQKTPPPGTATPPAGEGQVTPPEVV